MNKDDLFCSQILAYKCRGCGSMYVSKDACLNCYKEDMTVFYSTKKGSKK
jgi:uncharacterized OB-fold protein